MSDNRAALVVRTLVVGAVVVGTVGFVNAGKVVTVWADGGERQVRTFASSVGGVLAQQDLVLGPHDAVMPGSDAPLVDGARIELSRGRLVVLRVDGLPRQVWTTAQTVEQLTATLGSRYASAVTTASRSQRIPLTGLTLDLRMPKNVTVEHDGTSTTVVTTAPTVEAVLAEAGVDLGRPDLVSARLTQPPVDGLTVSIVRVTHERVVSRKKIRPDTVRRGDPALYKGQVKVLKAGRSGVRRTVYRLTFHDGDRVSREKVAVTVPRRPADRVVKYGTKTRPTISYPRTGAAIDQLNWAALAQCESSGNPRAVGGGGIYFGLYQFNLGTWAGVGGKGNPVDASPAEQTLRAKLLYRSRGAQPWPVCGARLFT